MYDDKLIIVTGGAGFIGSGVLRHLNDRGMSNLVVVDDLESDQKWKNLLGKKFVELISKHDIFDWLEGRETEIEAFIHLGACTNTMETDADYLMDNNYRFTVELAEYALKNEQRFIYASSAATYGDGSLGFSDNPDLIDQLRPLNIYGYSKQLFDQWAIRQGVLDKMVGLKYFNIYGPNESHKGKMASAITRMVPQALHEGNIRLFKSYNPRYADGEQERDFLYVKDAVKMTCHFLDNDFGGIFNIGSGVASTWNQLAQAVIKALNKNVSIKYIDMPEELRGQYQYHTCAEMSKHPWSHYKLPSYTLDEGVVEYVRDYLLTGNLW